MTRGSLGLHAVTDSWHPCESPSTVPWVASSCESPSSVHTALLLVGGLSNLLSPIKCGCPMLPAVTN